MLFLTLILFTFIACRSKKDVEIDTINISFEYPYNGQAFGKYSNIPIKIRFEPTGNKILHYARVHVLDSTNTIVKTLEDKHYASQGLVLYADFVTFTSGIYKIRAVATDENDLNPINKTISIYFN
jgi:hypothetical protein